MSDPNEDLLRRVALGELSPTDESVVRACADTEFEQELEALLDVRMEAERAGVLEEARREPAVPAEDRVEKWVLSQGRSGGPRSMNWLVAAAAVVLVGIGLWAAWPREDPAGNGDTILGEEGLRCLSPIGRVDDYPPFRWEGGPEGASYEVEVFDENGVLLEGGASGKLRATTWTPGQDDAAGWPDRIEWTVTCFDKEGMVFGRDTRAASR